MSDEYKEQNKERLFMYGWLLDAIVKILKTKCGISGKEVDPIVYNVIRHDVDGFMRIYYTTSPHIIKRIIVLKLEEA